MHHFSLLLGYLNMRHYGQSSDLKLEKVSKLGQPRIARVTYFLTSADQSAGVPAQCPGLIPGVSSYELAITLGNTCLLLMSVSSKMIFQFFLHRILIRPQQNKKFGKKECSSSYGHLQHFSLFLNIECILHFQIALDSFKYPLEYIIVTLNRR